MAYEGTEVPVSRSQEHIKKLVMGNGGSGVMFWSKPPFEGFEAFVSFDGVAYHVRIQAEVKPNRKRRDSDHESAERRVWRVLFYHMKSVYETSASGVLEFREMMLPYIVTSTGQTVGQKILPHLQKDLEAAPEKLLGPGNDTK